MFKNKKIRLIVIAIILIIAICFSIPANIEKYYCSQMLEAIEENDMEKLQRALEKGNPNSVLGTPWLEYLITTRKTPLQAACYEGNLEMVKLLVKNGADPYYRPANATIHALSYAVRSESIEIIKFLLETDAKAYLSRKSLTEDAAARATKQLFWKNPREPGKKMEILRELIAAGGWPHRQCLKDACYWGNEEVIRYLVDECGCDISGDLYILLYCRDFEKYSYEMFEFMLQHGANPYDRGGRDECAMDFLREVSPEWAEKLAELAEKYGYKE